MKREGQQSSRAAGVGAIFERQRATVGFGDLLAQDEPDARALWLGGEKRDK